MSPDQRWCVVKIELTFFAHLRPIFLSAYHTGLLLVVSKLDFRSFRSTVLAPPWTFWFALHSTPHFNFQTHLLNYFSQKLSLLMQFHQRLSSLCQSVYKRAATSRSFPPSWSTLGNCCYESAQLRNTQIFSRYIPQSTFSTGKNLLGDKGRKFNGVFGWYLRALLDKPILTKSVTASGILVLADSTTQVIFFCLLSFLVIWMTSLDDCAFTDYYRLWFSLWKINVSRQF